MYLHQSMPVNRYSKGNGEFYTVGSLRSQFRHAEDIRQLCTSEGLNKVPFRKIMRGDKVELRYFYMPFYADSPRLLDLGLTRCWAPHAKFLSVSLRAHEKNPVADRLATKLRDYTAGVWKEEGGEGFLELLNKKVEIDPSNT